MKKLGKKEDEHIVASDAELDSKLEVSNAFRLVDLVAIVCPILKVGKYRRINSFHSW